MPRNDRQTSNLNCAYCGAENYDFAAFCIACGEPFDRLADTDSSFFDDGEAQERRADAEPNETVVVARDRGAHGISLRSIAPLRERREAIIGVVLVVLVVGYAIYSWQRSSAESAAYKEGVAAEQKKDWDKAAAAFDRAGDQRDASGKAARAHGQVAERDRLYSEAIAAEDKQDWKTALSALQGVQAIQPSYADSTGKMVQIRGQVFKQELSNLVYLVSDGPEPGLYILDDTSRPYHLPGSDAQSTIHGMSSDGSRFVYDREKGGKEDAGSSAGGNDATGNDQALTDAFNDVTVKRVPVLVTLDKGRVRTRALANLNGSGMGIFSEKGLWWYSGWYSTPKDSEYVQYEVAYEGGQTGGLGTVVVTNPFSSTRVLALDPERSRLVLGRALGASRTVDRKTRLYLANADGTNQRLVQDLEGDVQSASISRDGHWLLAVTQWVIAHVGIEESVWLVPLGADGKGVAAGQARKLETLPEGGTGIPPHLSAALVPTDNMPARVVVGQTKDDLEQVTFYSSDPRAKTYMLDSLPAVGTGSDVAGFSNDGAYLGLRRQYGPDAKLEMVSLGKDDFLHSWSLPLLVEAGDKVKVSFAPRDDYVLAIVYDYDGPGTDYVRKIYSARVEKGGGMADLKLIAKAATQSDTTLPAVTSTADGSMLAYVNAQHELRVTFLDGAQDTLLADSVRAVWALGRNEDHSWER